MRLEDRETFFARTRGTTTWKTLYTAKGGESMRYLNVAHLLGGTHTWYFCIAFAGESYGRKNAIVWDVEIDDNDADVWGYAIPLSQGMKLGVRCSQHNAVNFTTYGAFGE